jgi:MFS family permease
MDHWGRRAGLAYAAIMSIIGRTLCAASQDVGMFITGRFFDGIGTFATFVAGEMIDLDLVIANADFDPDQSPSTALSSLRRIIVVSSLVLEAHSSLLGIR